MALNSSGIISIGGTVVGQSVELELGMSGTANASLNDASFRTLAVVPSGTIGLNNFYGKSNAPVITVPPGGNALTVVGPPWVVWMYNDWYNGSYGSALTAPWVVQGRTITRFQNTGGNSLILGINGYYGGSAAMTINGVSQTYTGMGNNGSDTTWYYFALVGALTSGLTSGATYVVTVTFI